MLETRRRRLIFEHFLLKIREMIPKVVQTSTTSSIFSCISARNSVSLRSGIFDKIQPRLSTLVTNTIRTELRTAKFSYMIGIWLPCQGQPPGLDETPHVCSGMTLGNTDSEVEWKCHDKPDAQSLSWHWTICTGTCSEMWVFSTLSEVQSCTGCLESLPPPHAASHVLF